MTPKAKIQDENIVELIKSVLKIFGAAVLIYFAVKDSVGDVVATVALPITASAVVFEKIIFKVVLWVGIYFILIAVADLIYQRQNFAKEMKMEKFEVKQEYKDTEGNPKLKVNDAALLKKLLMMKELTSFVELKPSSPIPRTLLLRSVMSLKNIKPHGLLRWGQKSGRQLLLLKPKNITSPSCEMSRGTSIA